MEPLTAHIEIHLHGRCHTGSYAVHNDMLTVWNRGLGSRSIRLAGRDISKTAQGLLHELVVTARPQAASPQDGEPTGDSPQ